MIRLFRIMIRINIFCFRRSRILGVVIKYFVLSIKWGLVKMFCFGSIIN